MDLFPFERPPRHDSFMRWLGSSALGVVIEGTIATKQLLVVGGAFLHVAPHNVQLSLEYATVVTGLVLGSPVRAFRSIGDAPKLERAAGVDLGPLSVADPLGPTFYHSNTPVLNKSVGHWMLWARCCLTNRA